MLSGEKSRTSNSARELDEWSGLNREAFLRLIGRAKRILGVAGQMTKTQPRSENYLLLNRETSHRLAASRPLGVRRASHPRNS